MQDRVSQYPGRVKLTLVDAANGIYDMERADEPIQEGTPLNTANLFSKDAADAIRINTLSHKIVGTNEPDTVDLGIRRICEYYGVTEWSNRVEWSFENDASGKGTFTETHLKYLAALDAVFVSVAFQITDQEFRPLGLLIRASSYDPAVGDLFSGLYGRVPMLSNIPESTIRPYMSHQDPDLYIELSSDMGISAANGEIIVTGMYHYSTQ